MFTGIIEELGQVKSIKKNGNVWILSVKAEKILEGVVIGDSVAVNGVCLTVVHISKDVISFDVMPETFSNTNISLLKISENINLERSLEVGKRLSGHFVTGHIDCQGIIRKKTFLNGNLCFEIAIPTEKIKFVISKGSIAIDGISLTLVSKKSNTFTVYIIPHTLENTTLKFKGPSSKVNIEFDILTKSVINK